MYILFVFRFGQRAAAILAEVRVQADAHYDMYARHSAPTAVSFVKIVGT